MEAVEVGELLPGPTKNVANAITSFAKQSCAYGDLQFFEKSAVGDHDVLHNAHHNRVEQQAVFRSHRYKTRRLST